MARSITVRLSPPQPARIAAATVEVGPFDTAGMVADLRELLEKPVRKAFGRDVMLVVREDRRAGIDLDGDFGDKAPKVRGRVEKMLAEVFESLDTSGYAG